MEHLCRRGTQRARPLGGSGGRVDTLWICVAFDAGHSDAVDAAGEATMYLRSSRGALEVSEHAALRMTQRGVGIDTAEATLLRDPFAYYHGGVWKQGYYDSAT